jgi:hypothetical protein
VGPAAAILVHELPVKFCQGHPRILDWEKKDFSRKLVTQKSTWDYEKMKFGFFFLASLIFLRRHLGYGNDLSSFTNK